MSWCLGREVGKESVHGLFHELDYFSSVVCFFTDDLLQFWMQGHWW